MISKFLHLFASTEHRHNGSPTRASPVPVVGTPIQLLRERAHAVRSAMSSKFQKPTVVDALEAQREFEPTIKDVFLAISAMSKKNCFPRQH